jgi:hypothetical protein
MSIAEEMTEGLICSHCNCFFTEAHGYPVICKPCFKQWQRENNWAGKKALLKMTHLQVAINAKEVA